MTTNVGDGSSKSVERPAPIEGEHPSPKQRMSSEAVGSAQEAGQTTSAKIDKLQKEDPKSYDQQVGQLVEQKLNGKNGRDANGHEVEGPNGRHYPGTTQAAVPELDANGKPTGKMIQLDKLSNGELAKLLDKTIADYDKSRDKDGEAYKTALGKSGLPAEQKAMIEGPMAEVSSLLKLGQADGLSTKDADRLMNGKGELSAEDKQLLERIGGQPGVDAMTKAREAFQTFRTHQREFNEKMAKDGIFFEGKSKLCCCTNARNKGIAMINRARTGNPPEGAACMSGNLDKLM